MSYTVPTRWSTPADADALAHLHADAWRYAYSGVIPDPGLSRLISRRGPEWWRRMHAARGSALLGLLDREVVAYALIGRSRAGSGGEIWELYVHPDCHGAGYGRGLFEVARDQFTEAGLAPLNVWCLEGNELGLNFYRALGGEESACGSYRIAGAQLGARRFTWH
jgi:GNAT superfamily N-acetyltransferase